LEIECAFEDVLLPNKYCPKKFEIGDKLRVFMYPDSEDRKIATTLDPKILLNQFGFLKVTSVSDVGAFMHWGLEKDLLVPFREQRQKMEPSGGTLYACCSTPKRIDSMHLIKLRSDYEMKTLPCTKVMP